MFLNSIGVPLWFTINMCPFVVRFNIVVLLLAPFIYNLAKLNCRVSIVYTLLLVYVPALISIVTVPAEYLPVKLLIALCISVKSPLPLASTVIVYPFGNG